MDSKLGMFTKHPRSQKEQPYPLPTKIPRRTPVQRLCSVKAGVSGWLREDEESTKVDLHKGREIMDAN